MRQQLSFAGQSIAVRWLVWLGVILAFPIQAQNWPEHAIRYIVPFPPGGGSDVVARAIALKLTQSWGQQVVVDNRPGAATILGCDLAAKAPADGYTLLHASSSYAINPALQKKMPYESLKDHLAVTQATFQPYVLVVHPSLPVHDTRGLIALLRSKPDGIIFASPGTGSGGHLATERFMLASQTRMLHVAYRGGSPALTDLISGQVQLMFPTILAVTAQLKSGRLRSVAVSSAQRSSALPDLPTIAESGLSGFDVTSWNGVMTPAGVTPAIIAKIHRDVVIALQSAEVRDRLKADGAEAVGSTPEQFTRHIMHEMQQWARVIKSAGLTGL